VIEVRFSCALCESAGLCTFECRPKMDADARRDLTELRTFMVASLMVFCRDKPRPSPEQLAAFMMSLLSPELNG
jgi:hypothetical protein